MEIDWGDEPWIKVYVRDWTDWLVLPFRAKVVFLLTVRKLDKAGLLPLGRAGLTGLPALLGHPDEAPFIQDGVQALLDTERWVVRDGALLFLDHLDMQAARTNDKLRAQASRQRRRAAAMQGELLSHSPSQPVTAHHSASRVEREEKKEEIGSPAQPAGRKPSASEAEYAWAMDQRQIRRPSIVSDQPLRPVVLNARLGAVLKEVGAIGFRAAWLAYLEDQRRATTGPPWSFAYFLAIWRTYYRPGAQSTQPAGAQEIRPGEALYGR